MIAPQVANAAPFTAFVATKPSSAMLNGKEYMELDPDNPGAALRVASAYLQKLKQGLHRRRHGYSARRRNHLPVVQR